MKRLYVLVLALLASACATVPPTRFAPREDANLQTDLVACREVADKIDAMNPNSYEDGRYAIAGAMANQVQRGTVKGLSQKQIFQAVQDSCMKEKGWTVVQ